MMVANNSAPNSLIVYRIHSCPNMAAVDKIIMSPTAEGCLWIKSIALPIELSLTSQNNDIAALHKFTHTIWLYVSM